MNAVDVVLEILGVWPFLNTQALNNPSNSCDQTRTERKQKSHRYARVAFPW